jgi:hypothetical protein
VVAEESPRDAEGIIRIRRDPGGLAEVAVGPRLTRAQVFLVEEWFRLRASDLLHLVLDCSSVDCLEVGALEALRSAVGRIARAGCHVSLAGQPEHLRRMMESDSNGLIPILGRVRSSLGEDRPAGGNRITPTG